MSVKFALLSLMVSKPKFGLQLKTEFEASTGEVWPLNVGQVYTTLKRLERDKCVEALHSDEADSGQKLYGLTDQGRSELDTWLASPPAATAPRNELVLKVLIALTNEHIDITELIQVHRRALLSAMQDFSRLKVDADTALYLVAEAEILRLEAMVRWLDTVEVRLKRGGSIKRSSIGHTDIQDHEVDTVNTIKLDNSAEVAVAATPVNAASAGEMVEGGS